MPENPLDILLPEVLEEFENSENHFFRQKLDIKYFIRLGASEPYSFFSWNG